MICYVCGKELKAGDTYGKDGRTSITYCGACFKTWVKGPPKAPEPRPTPKHYGDLSASPYFKPGWR